MAGNLGRRPSPLFHALQPDSLVHQIVRGGVDDHLVALVSLAQPANVDTVIVDGRILRQSGKFTSLDHAKVVREAQEAASALRTKANWPT